MTGMPPLPEYPPEAGESPASGAGLVVLGVGLALVWTGAVLGVWWRWSGELEAGLLLALALAMPVALIWLGCAVYYILRRQRADAAAQRFMLNELARRIEAPGASQTALAEKLDVLTKAAHKTETTLALFTTSRDMNLVEPSADRKAVMASAATTGTDEAQPTLALGTPSEALAPPLSVADFIRALHFPESPDDAEGFRALRRALQDVRIARLARAAQDVLTLLSQEGIYMDDLRPDRARPEVWRQFAQGARGGAVSALGGVRDRSSLALTSGRMRHDPVFRDAAHHFLRQFDICFANFEQNASDAEISQFADTRTARAFMLLGRVAGTFD